MARLFSEDEKEDVTMDLMLAIAPLAGSGTAMGAMVDDWRERCRGAREGKKGGEEGDGESGRGRRASIYANPCPFHGDFQSSCRRGLSALITDDNRQSVFHKWDVVNAS